MRSNREKSYVVRAADLLESEGSELQDLHVSQPSLKDVFVEMTGRRMSE